MEKPTLRSAALFFASVAILAPLASARQCGYNRADRTFESVYGGGQYEYSFDNQNEMARSIQGSIGRDVRRSYFWPS